MTRRKARSLSFLLVLAVAGVAHASPSPSPSLAERETARRLMDEGKARLKANEVARAIEAFERAHDIMHVPTTGIALARAHLAAGHLVEARAAALEVGRLPHDPGDPAVFETARKHAKELEVQIKPRIPTVRINIKGGRPARVAVDDVEVPASVTGEPVAVNPGKRVISARNAEGGEVKGEIEIAERDAKEIELTLPALREAAKTASPAPASTGPSLAGGANDAADLRPSGDRTPLAQGLLYGGLGVGIVGLAVGSISGAMTLSRASDVEPQCENDVCAPSAKSDLESANTLATVSTIAFIVGGAGVVAGVVGYFLPRRSEPRDRSNAGLAWDWTGAVRRSPAGRTLTIGPAGAGIGGSFQ
jgi:hypothetical protein